MLRCFFLSVDHASIDTLPLSKSALSKTKITAP